MPYRTKTYIAGDWEHDILAIDKLYQWKNNNNLNFDFIDAHEYKQSKDTSLHCTIKRSLKERLDRSKTFVLVVGAHTNKLAAGSCQYCPSYNSYLKYCVRSYSVDYKSYIQYECEEAVKVNMNIIVLYNGLSVNKSLCPDILKNKGEHISMYKYYSWNYPEIERALKRANQNQFE